jgi:hypothetical protein
VVTGTLNKDPFAISFLLVYLFLGWTFILSPNIPSLLTVSPLTFTITPLEQRDSPKGRRREKGQKLSHLVGGA